MQAQCSKFYAGSENTDRYQTSLKLKNSNFRHCGQQSLRVPTSTDIIIVTKYIVMTSADQNIVWNTVDDITEMD